jgi:hypothetical protein
MYIGCVAFADSVCCLGIWYVLEMQFRLCDYVLPPNNEIGF